MTLIPSLFATFFLSSLVLASASATAYSYDSKPDTTTPKNTYYNPKQNSNDHHYVNLPKSHVPKPTDTYNSKPYPYVAKPDYIPKPGYDSTPKVTTPKVPIYKPKPGNGYGRQPYPIAIEGLVVCKSGSKYVPIQGAVVKISCKVVDQNGYETEKPVSCESDAKGYFYKKIDLGLGLEGDKLKIGGCEAILGKSPVESCKYPTDVNKGLTGALLSSFRMVNQHEHLVKLYSVGPFFYTPNPAPPNPAGGY